MKTTDELHELIHSMTGAEKRYFKIFATRHVIGEENNYVQLFDLVTAQKKYNEAEIKDSLTNKNYAKRLSSEKVYLYKLLLKSLRAYHSGNSPAKQIRELLDQAEILFDKQLYKRCYKILQSAKKIAEEHEDFYHFLEISEFEQKINEHLYNLTWVKNFKEHVSNEKKIINAIQNHLGYRILGAELLILGNRHGKTKTKQEADDFKKLLGHRLLKSENTTLSGRALQKFYHIKGSINYALNNEKEGIEYFKKLIRLIESLSPERRTLLDDKRINLINNLLWLGMSFMKKDEVTAMINNNIDTIHKSDYYIHLIRFYTMYTEFEKLENILKEAEEWINNTNVDLEAKKSYYYYYMSYGWFITGNYKKSLLYINKLLLNDKSDITQDIYCIGKIMSIIIHFELGNHMLLPYVTKSVYRYLSKKNKIFKLENIILSFIRKRVIKARNENELQAAFISLREQLLPLLKNKIEKSIFERFDFIAWLESKIDKKSFSEALKIRTVQVNRA